MGRVAIVSDSAADLSPVDAAARGIAVVALEVTFGADRYRAGVDLDVDAFWRRMIAPDAPFPTTAAPGPGSFAEAFEAAFAAGADSVVCVDIAEELSATIQSARIARDMLPGRDIRIVDSGSASMGTGILAELAADLSAAGHTAEEIVAVLEDRRGDVDLYVTVDTLEYLRRGGRISAATAAIGSALSIKPIITLRDHKVEVFERVRTRSKARARTVELLAARPVERLAILHTTNADVEAFRQEVVARIPGGVDPDCVSVEIVGPSVGPHLGPGAVGGVVLYAR
ncbi:MAG TPA: DegV family protein [Candidatus Limnocylindrales bacterium]